MTVHAQPEQTETTTRAEWSVAMQNDLPDTSFAYVEPGEQDADGKTTPRTKRHLVYRDADGKPDAAHVRNALACLDQTDIPAAAKASARKKLRAAAKNLGIEVSDDSGAAAGRAAHADDPHTLDTVDTLESPASSSSDSSEVTMTANRSAAATPDTELRRVLLPATVRVVDAATRQFEVCATSEAVDSYDTVFGYEASKDAFTRWVGNIREMHEPKAVGRRVNVRFDDDARRIYVDGRVSAGAPDTWEKLIDGTLQGASIGASKVVWEQRRGPDGKTRPYATRYDLVELSLVDNPSNPDALGVSLYRAAALDVTLTALAEPAAEPAADTAAAPTTAETTPVRPTPTVRGAELPEWQVNPAFPVTQMTAQSADGVNGSARLSVPAPEAPVAAVGAPELGVAPVAARIVESATALAARRRTEDEIRAVGIEATRDAPAQQPHEGYDTYIARMRTIAARAELAERERRRAPAAAQSTQAAQNETAPVAPVVAVARADAETAPHAAAVTPPSVLVSASTARQTHSHVHTHADGTTHEHPHAHDHVAGVADAHSDAHGHEHIHTYRGGVATDSRLVTADDLRTPFGTSAASSAPAAGLDPTGGKGTLNTVTQDAGNPGGLPVSPIMTVQPQAVGHLDLYNTRDPSALAGGVPRPAQERPTPTDAITLNPAAFHEGGHPTAHGDDTGEYDAEANGDDHDDPGADEPIEASATPAASSAPVAHATPKNSGAPSRPAGEPAPRAAATSVDADTAAREMGVVTPPHTKDAQEMPMAQSDDDSGDRADVEGHDGDSDDVIIASRPPAGTLIDRPANQRPLAGGDAGKDSPQDTAISPNAASSASPAPVAETAGVAGGARSAATISSTDADVARVGARLSAESREAVHGVRDTNLAAVKALCAHCGCAHCQSTLAVLNGGLYDSDGDDDSARDDAVLMDDDTGEAGSERGARAVTKVVRHDLRAMRALAIRQDTEQRQALADLAALLREAHADLRMTVTDAQLTLADHTRGAAAESTRALSAEVTRVVAQVLDERLAASSSALSTTLSTELADAITTQVREQVVHRLEALASVAERTEADVERIANAPAQMTSGPIGGAPAFGVAPKALPGFAASGPLNPFGASGASGGADDPNTQIEALTAVAKSLPLADTATRSAIAGKIATLQQQARAQR